MKRWTQYLVLLLRSKNLKWIRWKYQSSAQQLPEIQTRALGEEAEPSRQRYYVSKHLEYYKEFWTSHHTKWERVRKRINKSNMERLAYVEIKYPYKWKLQRDSSVERNRFGIKHGSTKSQEMQERWVGTQENQLQNKWNSLLCNW